MWSWFLRFVVIDSLGYQGSAGGTVVVLEFVPRGV